MISCVLVQELVNMRPANTDRLGHAVGLSCLCLVGISLVRHVGFAWIFFARDETIEILVRYESR